MDGKDYFVVDFPAFRIRMCARGNSVHLRVVQLQLHFEEFESLLKLLNGLNCIIGKTQWVTLLCLNILYNFLLHNIK